MVSASGGPQPELFAEMARSLLAEGGVQETLQRIVGLAVEAIDGCDHAGITFLHGGVFSTPAATDDVPGKVDAIQYQTGEGPCIDAIVEHEVFRSGDLGQEKRWPNFAGRAQRETGVTSMMGFRLFVAGDTLGALNLFSKTADAFDDAARAAGSVFAAHAAIALSTAQHDQQMSDALQSRDVIGQAKGILMAKEGVTADEAFAMLRRASQRLNVKLRQLAEDVARTGVTPASSPASSPAVPPQGEPGG